MGLLAQGPARTSPAVNFTVETGKFRLPWSQRRRQYHYAEALMVFVFPDRRLGAHLGRELTDPSVKPSLAFFPSNPIFNDYVTRSRTAGIITDSFLPVVSAKQSALVARRPGTPSGW